MTRRERRSNKLPEGWLKGFIEAYDIQSTDDIKDALKDLIGGTVETMMQAELEVDLGYAKHDSERKKTDNSRNGTSPKTLRTEYGAVDIAVPRDRNSEFEPKMCFVKHFSLKLSSKFLNIINRFPRNYHRCLWQSI